MNCHFCQKPLTLEFLAPIQIIDPNRPQLTERRHERCKNHQPPVIYRIHNDGVVKFWFNIIFKGSVWGLQFITHEYSDFKRFTIYGGKPVQPILSLDFHPNITPENVAVKLPTLLTFL